MFRFRREVEGWIDVALSGQCPADRAIELRFAIYHRRIYVDAIEDNIIFQEAKPV